MDDLCDPIHNTDLSNVAELSGQRQRQTDDVVFAQWDNLNTECVLVVVVIVTNVMRHQLLCIVPSG